MMHHLQKLPLALAIGAVLSSASAMAVDFHGYARSVSVGPTTVANSSATNWPVPVPNTVSVTNAKPMPS